MKKLTPKLLTVTAAVALVVFAIGCASVTVINSSPEGAKVFVDEQAVGVTPFTYTDTKIIGSSTYVRLEKEGFKTLNTVMVRNEEVDAGAVIGGFFFWPAWLWFMKYKPVHFYELVPEGGEN
jgi:hypothetical protein